MMDFLQTMMLSDEVAKARGEPPPSDRYNHIAAEFPRAVSDYARAMEGSANFTEADVPPPDLVVLSSNFWNVNYVRAAACLFHRLCV